MSERKSPMQSIEMIEWVTVHRLGSWCTNNLAGNKAWLGHLYEIQEQLIAEYLGLDDVEVKK